MKKTLYLIVSLCLLLTTPALANISGSVWTVSDATAQNAIPANVPGTAPNATFTVANGPIDFTSASGYTLGQFLSSGGATCSGSICGSVMDNGTTGVLIEMTGTVTVTNGMTFTVTHDDGLTLIINGINLGFNPGPTAPVTSTNTYTGASGTFPFTLVYGECCGAPAVLQTSLPLVGTPTVPEPSSLLLLGTGLVGIATRLRKRFM